METFSKAVAQTCSIKKVFLEISQNSQENTCARVSYRTPPVAASDFWMGICGTLFNSFNFAYMTFVGKVIFISIKFYSKIFLHGKFVT